MKKRPMTLLEIMIVIFLIGTIVSVIAYNMKGSLDKGRAFKTEHAINQIKDIVSLEVANGVVLESPDLKGVRKVLEQSGLVKDPNNLLKDGWSNDLEISMDEGSEELKIISKKYNEFKEKKGEPTE